MSGTVGAALQADTYGITGIATAITAQVSEWRTSMTRGLSHLSQTLTVGILNFPVHP